MIDALAASFVCFCIIAISLNKPFTDTFLISV